MSKTESKIGRPRRPSRQPEHAIQAGAHRLLFGEWKKICRSLRKVEGGPEFLALPEALREKFFVRLALIASSKYEHQWTDAQLKSFKQAGIVPPTGKNEIIQRMLVSCCDEHPQVTLFSLSRLRARVAVLSARGRDYWMAGLGYTLENAGDGKMSQATRDGRSDLVKVARSYPQRMGIERAVTLSEVSAAMKGHAKWQLVRNTATRRATKDV